MSGPLSLLQLAVEVARKHERAPAGRISVVPVLVDDLDSALPVLTALCTLHEGRLMNTADPELHGAVPRTQDVVRREAVTKAMTGAPLSQRFIELVDEGDGVDARFVNPSTTAPSLGEQTALAVARAVAHRELDEREFAVIAYREGPVDLHFRRAIWRLAVDQLQGMPHKRLRTLVFVAEAQIEVDEHCQQGRGFQLAVDEGRLLIRKGLDDLHAEANRLGTKGGPLVIFLGAGFAASSRLPSGNTMRDAAIRRLLGLAGDLRSDELAGRFHDWVAERDWFSQVEQQMGRDQFCKRLTLEQVIRCEQRMDTSLPSLREFRTLHDKVVGSPGPAVAHLSELVSRAVGRIVLAAVNFDLLVETHTKVPLKVFASPEEFAEAPDFVRRYLVGEETAVPLLKLHGSIDRPETCVISTDQTGVGVGQNKLNALRVLLNENNRPAWIYVGASLRDLDLRPTMLGEEFGRGIDERWASPFLAESIEEFGTLREPFWTDTDFRRINDRLITETADSFMAALVEAWPTTQN